MESKRDATSSVDPKTGVRKFHRICRACERSFRQEEWCTLTDEEKWRRTPEWCTEWGVERDRKAVNKGDRWVRTGLGILQAVQEIRQEDRRTGTVRTKKERNNEVIRKAREAGDLLFSCLLRAKWEKEFADVGARMIKRYNMEAQLQEWEGILLDERSGSLQESSRR